MKMWADKEETWGYHLYREQPYYGYPVDLPEELLQRFEAAITTLNQVHDEVDSYLDNHPTKGVSRK